MLSSAPNGRRRLGVLIAAVMLLSALAFASPAQAGYRYVAQWGSKGSGNGQFNFGGIGAGMPGVAADSSAHVFVADNGNHRIQEFTTAGAFVRKWGSEGTADGQFSPCCLLGDLAATSSGHVLATDYSGNNYQLARVQEFDATGGFLRTWQPSFKQGTIGGLSAGAIATSPSGDVYVQVYYDYCNNCFTSSSSSGSFDGIERFSAAGGFKGKWGYETTCNPGCTATGDSSFTPNAIAVGPSGHVFVTDSIPGGYYNPHARVDEFDASGNLIRRWGSQGSGDGQFLWGFSSGDGIAVDRFGHVFVSDGGNSRIQEFGPTGTFIQKWGSYGSGDGQFNAPEGIAVDSGGAVYVVDAGNSRIQKFSAGSVTIDAPKKDEVVDADTALHAAADDPKGTVRATIDDPAATKWCYSIKPDPPPVSSCIRPLSGSSPYQVKISYKDLQDELRALQPAQKLKQGENTLKVYALSGGQLTSAAVTFQWHLPPIIFIPGFGGTTIMCGDTTLFPQLKSGFFIDFKHMRLAADGFSPYPDGDPCTQSAVAAGLVDTVAGTDVYGAGEAWVRSLADPVNGRPEYTYTYDWRRAAPFYNVGGLDALVDHARQAAKTKKVVIVAHSMGGLVLRTYINDPARAAKVTRALTIGTPYWGSPKSVFAVTKGWELPDVGDFEIDAFAKDADFRNFAQTSSGLLSLIPSANYPQWLGIDGGSRTRWLSAAQIPDELAADFGASATLLKAALAQHAQQLDGFKTNGVDYRVLVSGGTPTVGTVILAKTIFGWEVTTVEFVDGDGTVPLISQKQQKFPGQPVLGEQIPIYVQCNVPHMKETEDVGIQQRIGGWLADDEKVGPSNGSCAASGFELNLHTGQSGGATAQEAASFAAGQGALTLAQASAAGLADVVSFGEHTFVSVRASQPVTLALPGGTKSLAVTPLQGSEHGAPKTYSLGPGAVVAAGGSTIAVSDNSGKVSPTAKAHVAAPNTVAIVKFAGKRAEISPKIDHGTAYLIRGARAPTTWRGSVKLPVSALRTLAYGGRDTWGNAEPIHYLRAVAAKRKGSTLSIKLACSRKELGPCTGRVRSGKARAKFKLRPGRSKTVRLHRMSPRATVTVYDGKAKVEKLSALLRSRPSG